MKAAILCAGHGTRLRPLTNYISKAMVPVAGVPILERIVRKLVEQGFPEQIVALSVFADQVRHYFGDGGRFGARIDYSINTQPSGTAGEIAHMRPLLQGETDVLVHYGDILSDLDAHAMADEHLAHSAAVTIGLVTGVEIHAGIADVEPDGRVGRFVEKPPLQMPANAAIFVLGRTAIDRSAPGLDFSHDVFPELIASGQNVRGFIDDDAYWLDVGRLSDLDKANEFFGGSSDEH